VMSPNSTTSPASVALIAKRQNHVQAISLKGGDN